MITSMVPSDMSVTLANTAGGLEPGFRGANRMVIGKFHRGNVKAGVVDRPIDAALATEL
jgi:hypothetical protein